MKRTIAAGAMLSSLLMPQAAVAGPACPDLVGSWTMTLSCVGVPREPAFEDLPPFPVVVDEQRGCLFHGRFNFFPWVGVIAADGTVYTDHEGARGVGELTARRAGVYTVMNFVYSFAASGPAPATACAGSATRD